MTRAWMGVGIVVLGLWVGAGPARAQTAAAGEQRWALIVTGASGGAKYAEQMRAWRSTLETVLVDRYGFDRARVRSLVDETVKDGTPATAANVRGAIGALRKEAAADALILLVLLGHGTFDGETAKFNLVGPDLSAADWAAALADLPGRLVVVNTTEASFPFLESLSAPNRIVITATDSAAQKYSTVFPEYFIKALNEASTDLDKNGRTSIYEAFAAASQSVKQHYEQRGQLTTERALIDDNGDRVGRLADAQGPDGGLARIWYLDAENPAAADNPELAELLRKRRDLEAAIEAHRQKKGQMPDPVWQTEFERLVLELARVSRRIREKS